MNVDKSPSILTTHRFTINAFFFIEDAEIKEKRKNKKEKNKRSALKFQPPFKYRSKSN